MRKILAFIALFFSLTAFAADVQLAPIIINPTIVGGTSTATVAGMLTPTSQWAGTTGGSATAYTLTPSPAITAYADGQRFLFTAHATNTAAGATFAISGLAALPSTMGSAAMHIGGFVVNSKYWALVESGATAIRIAPYDPVSSLGDTMTGSLSILGSIAAGTTAAPVSKLHVVGASQSYGSISNLLTLNTGTGAGTDESLLFGIFDNNYVWIQGVKPGIAYRNLLLNPNGGNVGIGASSATAKLHLAAGTAAAGTAPLKLTSGTNLTTPEAGAVEYDGANFTLTPVTTRRRIVIAGLTDSAIAGSIQVAALAIPSAPSGTPSATGGTIAASATNHATIIALDAIGSVVGTQSAAVTTTGATSSIAWAWTAVAGASSYQIWVSQTAGTYGFYYTSTTTAYLQTLPHTSGTAGTIPTLNTSGALTVAGEITGRGWVQSIKTVTAAYTVQSNDYTILADATGAAFSVTLPAAASAYNTATGTGDLYIVKRINAGANAVTIQAAGAELIDGVNTQVLPVQWSSINMQSNGTSWFVQ